jgi:prepilin-type N-terminal cleavage/methylation domain-containing protein
MKRNGFTLIELLVVVAIIGILAAVGTVAYNGYTLGAKVNATKAQYKTIVKHQIHEITKCQLGMIDTIGNPDYGSKPCPLRAGGAFNAAGEWIHTFGNQCNNPGGIYFFWSNPYKPINVDDVGNKKNNNPCNYDDKGTKIKDDEFVGYINYRKISDTEASLSSCWKVPCSSPENRGETIIDFSDY